MAGNTRLANALERLRAKQAARQKVFASAHMSRDDREILTQKGFLRPIIRGWSYSSSPMEKEEVTTPWAMSYWEFLSRYASSRFGDKWVIAPTSSLSLITDDLTPPKSLTVNTPEGNNRSIDLPHGYQIFFAKTDFLKESVLELTEGVRVSTIERVISGLTAEAYEQSPIAVSAALSQVRDAELLAYTLISENATKSAGHVLKAYESMGREDMVETLKKTFKDFGFRPRTGPLTGYQGFVRTTSFESGLSTRLRGAWAAMREQVLEFRPDPATEKDAPRILKNIVDSYKEDAYHSLSIEGYTVSEELISKVRSGTWSPEKNDGDSKDQNALAAKGYYDAFQRVKAWVENALKSDDSLMAGFEKEQKSWQEALFWQFVNVGAVRPESIKGYRNHAVFIKTALHVPPAHEKLMDGMETYHDLMREEPDAFVRAVLGHWALGYIHPFADGNGRTARFTMNAMLTTGGYEWVVIRTEDKGLYMKTLDEASRNNNARPFAEFIGTCLSRKREINKETQTDDVLAPDL